MVVKKTQSRKATKTQSRKATKPQSRKSPRKSLRKSPRRSRCKNRRVRRNSDGSPNQEDVEHNRKCEQKYMLIDNPWMKEVLNKKNPKGYDKYLKHLVKERMKFLSPRKRPRKSPRKSPRKESQVVV